MSQSASHSRSGLVETIEIQVHNCFRIGEDKFKIHRPRKCCAATLQRVWIVDMQSANHPIPLANALRTKLHELR